MYEAILHIEVAYILLLCKLNCGYYNWECLCKNIFQMEHFSAVKFAMGYEKNMSFLRILKSPKVY